MGDQTFHTPSFGDEDFEIPTMNAQQQQQLQQQQLQQHHNQHHHPMDHPQPSQHHYHHHPNSSPHMVNFSEQQQYNQWHPEPQHLGHHNQGYQMQSPNQGAYPIPTPTSNNSHQSQQQMLLMQPPQQSPQMPPQMSPQLGGTITYVGRSPQGPHGSTENTSEDSDDNGIPTNTLKRPSPEPIPDPASSPNNNAASKGIAPVKKPKVSKKKKKRDPNEPQKPVSAYALFFRDTQAAIKGQNPSASFGEVSKIVASMWDSLPVDHKNVYKKKTEAAKKEYLKALAAYRASLVSQGTESDLPQPMYSPPPPQPQPIQQPQNIPPAQQPPQQHISNHPQQTPQHLPQGLPIPQTSPHQQQYPTYQSPYRSPPHKQVMMQQPNMQMQHHNQMMVGGGGGHPMNQQMMGQMNPPPQQAQPMNQMHNQQQNMNNGGMMGMGIAQQQYMNQQIHPQHTGQPHQMAQHTVQQQQQGGPPPVSGTPPSTDPTLTQQPQQCIRHGCTNQAIVNSDWEDEYCSNECVITHCRDVYGNWVQTNTNQQQQQTFSAVKQI